MIGYTELFHPQIHGFNESSYKHIDGFFMTVLKIKTPNEYLNMLTCIKNMNTLEYSDYIVNKSKALNYQREILFHIKMRNKMMFSILPHPSVRNFLKIQEHYNHPDELHILKIYELPTGESICIIKTFWLKCIQRKWKRICEYNNDVISKMKKIDYLHKRELQESSIKTIGLHGMWHLKIF